IFLKPPSFEILKERLLNRKTEDKASLNKRIKKAKLELKYQDKFDYVLINDKLEISLAEAENLVRTFLEIQ
ncbi:MAG TPA: guanylate kinase, partial [Saprospiraceae bacterium]|nr:guanylate kinase [Saprospiraceae bacterium]